MAKTIKIEDSLYHSLNQYRAEGETFSDALRRVLQAAGLVPKVVQFTDSDREVLERYRMVPRTQ